MFRRRGIASPGKDGIGVKTRLIDIAIQSDGTDRGRGGGAERLFPAVFSFGVIIADNLRGAPRRWIGSRASRQQWDGEQAHELANIVQGGRTSFRWTWCAFSGSLQSRGRDSYTAGSTASYQAFMRGSNPWRPSASELSRGRVADAGFARGRRLTFDWLHALLRLLRYFCAGRSQIGRRGPERRISATPDHGGSEQMPRVTNCGGAWPS